MADTKDVCKAAEQVSSVVENIKLEVAFQFPCPVYIIDRPDFLESVMSVSEESLAQHRKEQEGNDLYPVIMSGNYFADPRIAEFSKFVGSTAWNILSEQGYAMQDLVVSFTEMWTQEHHKHSSMEQHTHGYGSQIVGFYFLDVPENSSRILFHDPRMGKAQTELLEQDVNQVTVASRLINFEPKPGMLIFSNSWLPHSFTRHASEQPLKFVHFNLTVQLEQNALLPEQAAEVI